jgi:hypothetical protein
VATATAQRAFNAKVAVAAVNNILAVALPELLAVAVNVVEPQPDVEGVASVPSVKSGNRI